MFAFDRGLSLTHSFGVIS